MGLYAHSTHVYVADKDHGRVLASGILKSSQPLVLSSPYGRWINVYLSLGMSYKDVPDLPTATYVELNCYNGEGLDLRLYTADRLACLFQSGCGEREAEDDHAMEIAAAMWEKENPGAKETADGKPRSFWTQAEAEQEKWLSRARQSGEFRQYLTDTEHDVSIPDLSGFDPYLPDGRTLDDLERLLNIVTRRFHGPPSSGDDVAAIRRWMDGKVHSSHAEDYVQAIARFFDFRGALWSLESIQQHQATGIDRGIIKIEKLDQPPPTGDSTTVTPPNAASPEARLRELSIVLPEVPAPVAVYIPATRIGNMAITSGQLPTVAGKLARTGKVGPGALAPEVAAEDARQACLNALAALRAVVGGSLDNLSRIVRVVAYVQSTPDFSQQSIVSNGASKLLEEIFGEAGKHVRTSVGMVALPLDATCEIELWAEVKPGA